MNGKGDTPRPKAVTEDEFGNRWVKTFCPPDRPMVKAEDQKGLRNPHHWPATDPMPTTDPDD